MELADPELGVEVSLPGDWEFSNSPDGREMVIKSGKRALVIVRGGRLRLLDALTKLGCETAERCWGRDVETVEGKSYVIALIGLGRECLEGVRITTPALGLDEPIVRRASPRYKWFVSLPANWSVREIGEFGDGVLFGAGRIRGWILFYPAAEIVDLKEYVKRRVEVITGGSASRPELRRAGDSWSASSYFERGGTEFKVFVEAKRFMVSEEVSGCRGFRATMESAYLVPRHVEEGAEEVINNAFLTFTLGVNFMLEYLRMKEAERALRGFLTEAELVGISSDELVRGVADSVRRVLRDIISPQTDGR